MEFGPILAEGKTKIVYAHPTNPDQVILRHKDGITAGDGARRSVIEGKGALAGQTTANVFRLLNRAGIATHFIAAPEPTLTVARRCAMIPLEVVMRRLPAGSYLRRHPEAAGQRFEPVLVEFFLKDDARHDPQVTPAEIVEMGIATPTEVEQMTDTGRAVFSILEAAWAKLDVTLVDLKIEFGRAGDGALLVADVIDNDSWRIWPGGDPNRMLDKQVYRNAQVVDETLLADVYQRYALVAELTGRWENDHN
ncbi:phosphoribosylaminoimidazolesuccinocarboxamide synthase [Chloroflexus sp.]|uniref:phosphoribosylaminoimidazolesuccinocarboxamide synthase n=1 Tax=Chloroflexus sp. TaxID=1904827 RepID=UPI002610EB3B|nr:phosphoribosylaminoimidazolesuccinocarboxamide synthase [uncultured Chloroflexus sp.]